MYLHQGLMEYQRKKKSVGESQPWVKKVEN